MIVFFAVYLGLTLWGIRFVSKRDDFLSFDQTNALKGLGIMTVFFNHIYNGYLTPHSVMHHPYFDEPFVFFEETLTGMFVGMFLFFSGYGVLESVKKKGQSYINQMPVRRLGTTLVNFDIAVLVFLIANLILGLSLVPSDILLSFLAWESIGNSNWYIFAILCCYFISYISLKICSSHKMTIVITFLLVVIYYILMSQYKYPWWYNTVFCYPFGMLYSEYKDEINKKIAQRYVISIVVTIILFLGTLYLSSNAIMCNIAAVSFSFICVMGSMKVSLNSRPLIWMGTHLFPLYIYQRLPMFVLDDFNPELIENTPPHIHFYMYHNHITVRGYSTGC